LLKLQVGYYVETKSIERMQIADQTRAKRLIVFVNDDDITARKMVHNMANVFHYSHR